MALTIYAHEVFAKPSVMGMKKKNALASRKAYYLTGSDIFTLTHQRPVARATDVRILLEMDEIPARMKEEAIKLGAKTNDEGQLYVEASHPDVHKFVPFSRVEDKDYVSFENDDELNDAVAKGAIKDEYGAYFPAWYWVNPKLKMIRKSLDSYF